MKDTLKLALRQMGYRPMGQGVWGKPVAFHLLTVKMEGKDAKMTNFFIGAKSQVLVWDSVVLPNNEGDDYKDYEVSIKMAEYSTKTDVGLPFSGSMFGFVTKEDRFADVL